jgi:hypothetical protein
MPELAVQIFQGGCSPQGPQKDNTRGWRQWRLYWCHSVAIGRVVWIRADIILDMEPVGKDGEDAVAVQVPSPQSHDVVPCYYQKTHMSSPLNICLLYFQFQMMVDMQPETREYTCAATSR